MGDLKISAVFLFLLTGALLAVPLARSVAATLPQTCDPSIWDALDARAWVEGKHDMEAAQSIIRQPDSVLEISCYEQHLVTLHNAANLMFSDNMSQFTDPDFFGPDDYEPKILSNHRYWGQNNNSFMAAGGWSPSFAFGNPFGYPDIDNQDLDRTLIRVIRAGLKYYWWPNFHTGARPAPSAVVCSQMKGVWEASQCSNFSSTWFLSKEEIACRDMRACEPVCGRPKWPTMFGRAWTTTFPPPNPPDYFATMNPATTFLTTRLFPASCNTVQAVPTGLIVRPFGTNADDNYPDAVCPAIGCYYNYSSGKCN